MKKIFVFLLSLLMFCSLAAVAVASPSFYANPRYNLATLQTVKVAEIVNSIPASETAVPMAEETMMSAIYKGAQKNKLEIMDVRQKDIDTVMKFNTQDVKAAYLQVVIKNMSTTSRYIPGRWETKTEYEERVWYDRNGGKHKESIPYKHDVWVPESWHTDVHVEILYNLYDEAGTVLATSNDKRDRDDESEPNAMLGRSTAEFFKQVLKKGNIKK